MKRLVLATSNRGKVAEMQPLLADAGFELITQGELGVADAIEDGHTFVENALIKARHAARATGLPALADDSGLIVDALGGAPGLISAHYAGVHGDAARNIRKLLGELAGVPDERRTARFYSLIVLLRHAGDPQPLIAEGVWEGRILAAPRGDGGFGYDPVFFDPVLDLGAAELPAELKEPGQPSWSGAGRTAPTTLGRRTGMFVVIWEYEVQPGAEPAFERLYGADGGWVALFREFPGYVETELFRDTQSGRYLSLDRWQSEAHYDAFQDAAKPRYAALDAEGDALTVAERRIGRYSGPC